MTDHTHQCACCGTVWNCLGDKPHGPGCSVDKAEEANGIGPYCLPCLFGIQFLRASRLAGIDASRRLALIDTYQRHEHKERRKKSAARIKFSQ
jgi:hypothetical protein